MRYDGIVFDLDGTLLDTLKDLTNAVNTALVRYQLPPKSLDEVRQYVGNGITKLMERAIPGGYKHQHFDDMLAIFKKEYALHCRDYTAPYPGVMDMLSALHQHGISIAIVSNKADFAVKELNPYYFKNLIDIALGEDEAHGIKKKPAPDMVNLALRKMKCHHTQAVYVGDSDVDLATATSAGMPCISVSWGFRSREFLKEHGATVIVDTPEEILNLCLS